MTPLSKSSSMSILHNADKISIDIYMPKKVDSQPNKLLQAYLKGKASPFLVDLTSLSGRVHRAAHLAMLDEFERSLFAMADSKELSEYHIVKLICHRPQFLSGKEDLFRSSIQAFEQEVQGSNDNKKALLRAAKISKLIRQSDAFLRLAPASLQKPEFTLLSADRTPITVNSFEWRAYIPAWRPMLEGRWGNQSSTTQSHAFLQLVDQFIQTKQLPDLSIDDLLKLHVEVHGFGFQELETAIANAAISKITDANLFNLLNYAVEYRFYLLIASCIEFINPKEKNITLRLVNDKIHVHLKNLNPNIRNILDFLKNKIAVFNISTKSAGEKLLKENIVFSEVNTVFFSGEDDIRAFDMLGTCFPNAKKCNVSAGLQNSSTSNWGKVEILDLGSGKAVLKKPVAFPNLKLALQYGYHKNFQINEVEGILFASVGLIKHLVFSPFKHLITDDILLEIMSANFGNRYFFIEGLQQIDLRKCTISQSVIDELKRMFPRCEILSDPATLGKHQLAPPAADQEVKKQKTSQDAT